MQSKLAQPQPQTNNLHKSEKPTVLAIFKFSINLPGYSWSYLQNSDFVMDFVSETESVIYGHMNKKG